MSQSLNTAVVYGYDIGGDEDEWKFTEYDRDSYEMHWPVWVALSRDDEPDDFIDQAEERLLVKVQGFEVIPWQEESRRPDGYYDRLREAEKALGMEFHPYGVSDYQAYVLGFELASGYPLKELNYNTLLGTDFEPMDEKLARAVEALELHPEQLVPKLFMIASYF